MRYSNSGRCCRSTPSTPSFGTTVESQRVVSMFRCEHELDCIYDFVEGDMFRMLRVNVTLRICESIRGQHEPSLVPGLSFGAKFHEITSYDDVIGIQRDCW